MSDGLFFTVGIVFFFILWVASGGPTKPISFAGPFITPITNEGQTQTGYGPQLGGTLSAGSSTESIGTRSGANATNIPDTSSYAGHVFLTHSVGGLTSSDPEQEYLGLEVSNSSSASVNISGWKVMSAITGASATIPNGVQMLRLGSVQLLPITLQPGNTATITSGASPVNVSFEQNTCANYLTDQNNYASCFASHSGDANFLTGIWRIYLSKGSRLWKNSNETIELVDSSGNVVDSFSY